ncbi:hypothetical protein [Halogeometricum borinquense]|uniref:hypothetical protein n=1 Tax=Halogeometricum borinquense TaxID=60847 RepID=UPI003416CA7A
MVSTRVCLGVFLAVCLLTVPVSIGETADYRISTEESVDIPDRTIETKWGEQTVTDIGKYQTGDYVSVTTNAPSDKEYTVRIINSEQELMHSNPGVGDDESRFELDRYDPGTYAVAIMNGSEEVYAVQPLVVAGYTVDQRAPESAESDEQMEVSVELTKVSNDVSSPPATVEVVVGDDADSVRTTATKQSDLTYTATVDLSSLSTGDYRVYTTVRRDNEVFGEKELIGLSDSQQLSVVAEQPSTPSTTEPQSPAETESPTTTPATSESAPNGQQPAGGDSADEDTDATTSSPADSTTEQVTDTTSTDPPQNTTATTTPTQTASPTATSTAVQTTTTETPVLPDISLLILFVSLTLLARRATN